MRYEPLKNPPITEALIDVRVRPLDGSAVQSLKSIQPIDYPIAQPQLEFTSELSMSSGASATANTTRKELGWLFKSEAHPFILQTRINGFTLSRLSPYSGWDSFREEAAKHWASYRQVGGDLTVTRLAVRYINHISLPREEANLANYFRTYPEVSGEFEHRAVEGFMMLLQIPQPDIRAKLNLRQGVSSGKEEGITVVLDIDLYRAEDVPQTDSEIWEYFDKALCQRKDDIFFQCLTKEGENLLRRGGDMTTMVLPKPRGLADVMRAFYESSTSGPGSASEYAHQEFFKEKRSLNYTSSLKPKAEPIEKLRTLEEGWDGKDAEVPSDFLLGCAEGLWLAIDDSLPAGLSRPSVRMARNGYISFSWMDSTHQKEMHLWIHEEENFRARIEVHLRAKDQKVDINCAETENLVDALVQYFSA